ncbi:MAG: hypothetical protein HC849_34190 [Oscillatoriales cyanobacterium RU_3_3]|nr:hypothetical protein [Microcoleus sp. SU_5_6]NJL68505.1 hypothetical protein [Microcoleus sp. SM1_3_4]NJM64049.1 hypothetical protein [Oscillatoriales cyanobacterium RU_3_3]NJR24063.1 hypothetical protein [Richelia sp. CSU_2_1]
MSPHSPGNPDISQIDRQQNCSAPVIHVVAVSRIDRWQIYNRLQELMIPCWCPKDGSLQVQIRDNIDAVLLRSVVQQFVASRQEMVNWLERCWQAESRSP